MRYTTINIQGNLISEEILRKIENAEANSQSAEHFGFERGSNLRSEIELAWSKIKLEWRHIGDKMENLPPTDPYGTALSRRWMEVFLGSIGFELSRQKSSLTGTNQQTYPISHTAENLDHLPIHIAGFTTRDRTERNTLDIKSRDGNSRFSPHGLVQEYLNVTEHVYGITTNGYYLRLLRDSGRLVKLAYIEFDIKRMLDEDKYSEFTTLYRLLHGSRFPKSRDAARESIFDIYYQESIDTGNRIREGLSKAVKESLLALGKGFLQHEDNTALREKISSGNLSPKDYYRQLLRVIYRLLFLMVTEERNLVYDEEDKDQHAQKKKLIYQQYYSIARLRSLSQKGFVFETRYTDLWTGLVNSFRLFDIGSIGIVLGIKPLGGDLFNLDLIADLIQSKMSNKLLLECIKNLNEFRDEQNNLVPINYRSLDVEELGSVYEGLLDLHPVIDQIDSGHPDDVNFTFHEGTDRKTTGSYYTRPELVNELIKSALIPVIEERLKEKAGNKEAQIKALLSLKVCDPAAGSGHMLLAAARTIAWYLARIESGEENPAPAIYRKCLRDTIQHCVYAVDMNPDAVELCKLALWLEGHNSGKPLSFLDHKVRNGNSLVGVTDLNVLSKPLPDDAFNPVTGDDAAVCRELKRRNAAFRRRPTYDLFSSIDIAADKEVSYGTTVLHEMEWYSQDTLDGVNAVKDRFQRLRASQAHEENACHIWTAAYFTTYTTLESPTNPSSEKLAQYFTAPSQYGPLVRLATSLAEDYKFFHWPLAFPDVFSQGGFDVMLGNPPWERIKLQEKEFYITKDTKIANAKNKAEREILIKELPEKNPKLYLEFKEALHASDCTSKFFRTSGRFPLTAIGDINTYATFSELFTNSTNQNGTSGIIVPIGIATDSSTKDFFSSIILAQRLKSLIGFENETFIFPDVHHSTKFCCLTITGQNKTNKNILFSFFNRDFDSILSSIRSFYLTQSDFININPNTKTCPIFRTKYDAELTAKIYRNTSILIQDQSKINIWGLSFNTMFHMANDSHLFNIIIEDDNQIGPYKYINSKIYLPLYEAKMITHFDHRFASYEKALQSNLNSGILPQTDVLDKSNSHFYIQPKYFIAEEEVLKLSNFTKTKWFFGFREITSSISIRTAVFCIIPYAAVGNKIPLIDFKNNVAFNSCLQLANFNSIVLDYVLRQKLGGISLSFFYVKQLPIIEPSKYSQSLLESIVSQSMELTYTSWDIKSFADDFWKDGDENLRSIIKNQWIKNKSKTGGHEWNPPEWCEIDTDGCPLPPFKWNEDRRAILKAELDAIYAHLYGLTTDELRYILDPQDVYGPEFPGETFRVLKEKEIRQYGEYRTRRLVLEAWERMGYGAS